MRVEADELGRIEPDDVERGLSPPADDSERAGGAEGHLEEGDECGFELPQPEEPRDEQQCRKGPGAVAAGDAEVGQHDAGAAKGGNDGSDRGRGRRWLRPVAQGNSEVRGLRDEAVNAERRGRDIGEQGEPLR